MPLRAGILFVASWMPGLAAELDADEVMARVAANQERAEEARASIVFEREVVVRILKDRELRREEKHVFTVTPTPEGFEAERDSFEGRLRHKGELTPYAEPHSERTMVDADAIVSEILLDFANDKNSRDGVDEHFFPLTEREQTRYVFKLLGEERIADRDTYRIAFEPRKKSREYETDRAMWRGEAFIDKAEFQPVYVTTDAARKVPVAVRTMLGTNFKQVGFSLQFEEVEEGVWLPVSYGGEFKIKVLFGYNRNATVSLVNRKFRRTDVESSIDFAEPE